MPRKNIGHVKSSELVYGSQKRKGTRKKVKEILDNNIRSVSDDEEVTEDNDPIDDVGDIMPLSAHDRKYNSYRDSQRSTPIDEEWGSLFDSE